MAASRRLMALAITATMVVELAMAANYTVGDSDGWEIGTDFRSWTSSKKFAVGDVLTFEYSANHDVLEVNEADFSSCAASNPVQKHTGGSTAITLPTAGKRYFICGVAGHCSAGMKLEIDTLATSSPPPSSTETPPAPTSPPASPPKATAKPPAKSPSAPPPGSAVSPPAPPTGPTSPSPSPAPESPIPQFPFDLPLNPTVAPTTPPPPPPSSAYKCSFGVHLSVGLSFVIIVLLAL